MRIISGKYKGRRITAPKNLPVRPTTDLAKESLFNILNNHYYFDSISVVDLFSGTGNIAFEFASRGTSNIHAVDGNYNCVKFINKISTEFNFPINAFKSDVFKFKGHAGALKLSDMNSFITPLVNVELKGLVKETFFVINGNFKESEINLSQNYEEIDLVILNKKKTENKFLSNVANIFIRFILES